MHNLLEIKNLTKHYEHFSLQDISFNLEPGYIMGFVGPNGAGKTTTLNLILNALSKDAGQISLFGMDSVKDEQAIKQKLGIVFDHMFLIKDWNLLAVEKAYQLFYKNWDTKKYHAYLKQFGLHPHLVVKDLSRGMSVKLLLAAALSHDAQLLILDEPTSGLDPEARDELMTILQDYIEDGTRSVIFSTHITSDLEKIADYITCLNQGKLYYTGTKDGLLETYCMVKGAPSDHKLNHTYLIGARKFATGFEALVLKENLSHLQGDLLIEKASIDEIIIFTSRGGKKNHER